MRSNALASLVTALVLVPSLAGIGCGGQEDDGVGAGDILADEGTVTLTVVKDGPDGTPIVTERKVTAAEQRAMTAEREARARGGVESVAPESAGASSVAPDVERVSSAIASSACSGNAVWLYWGANNTGDMLCYDGAGVASLSSVCHKWQPTSGAPMCVETWAGHVASAWGGNTPGSLVKDGTGRCSKTCVTWGAFEKVTSISCASKYLDLAAWGADACWLADSGYTFNNEYPANTGHDWTDQIDGVTSDGRYWYISTETRIWRVPLSAGLDRDLGDYPNIGIVWPGFDHIGDIDYYAGDGRIYVALEQNKSGNHMRGVGILDRSLNNLGSYLLPNDNCSWVAVNPQDGYLYTAPTFDTVSELRYYNRNNGVKHGTLKLRDASDNLVSITRVQGGAFSSTGKLYMVSDARGDHSQGGIWGFDVMRPGIATRVAHMAVNYEERWAPWPWDDKYTGDELQGITILDLDNGAAPSIGGQIHMMMIDVDGATDDVYFKHYRITDVSHL